MNDAYKAWLIELKSKIKSSQIKAALAVNTVLIEFYWDLGESISEKEFVWGNKLIETLSHDLKKEFPDVLGFSVSNLKYCKRFYQFYKLEISQQAVDQIQIGGKSISQQAVDQLENIEKDVNETKDEGFELSQRAVGQFENKQEKEQQLVTQIPWGHNIVVFTKSKSVAEALFYIQQTISNGWSRAVLTHQIESGLHQRQGKAIHNFKATLPEATSDLASQLLKDPYKFDFTELKQDYKERELENALVDNVTKFLLELGTGFAYVGRQVPLFVGKNEYNLDLLFYHLKLRAYVIIELKTKDFEPEHAGKLSFYLSAANDLLKHATDNPTIGLLICKNKNNIIAEYALQSINQPIGVSEYELTKLFPDELKSSLPTIEEIENELRNLDE
jgi:predicted nuclease of restriction endonuclease-like (RecB) superfamily